MNDSSDRRVLVAIVGKDDMPAFDEPLFVVETVCVVWFTGEVALRFAAAPDHLAFFRSLMNVIDVVSIVPYFITLSTVIAHHTDDDDYDDHGDHGGGGGGGGLAASSSAAASNKVD